MNLEVLLVLILTSMSCCLIGIFLFLKRMSMLTDALSHTIILGVVLGYFITHSLNYPVLLISGIFVGFLSVYLINSLKNVKTVNEDSAIAIVFPLFFGVAILLISIFAKNIHLDLDMILLGEVIFSSLERMNIFGFSIPVSIIWCTIGLIVNIIFVKIFYKELKITSFDPVFACLSGFSAVIVEYLLIGIASWTTVISSDAVGFILVISFMIGPVITSRMLCNNLTEIIFMSLILGIINVFLGYSLAIIIDASISGMIAAVTGMVFFIILLFAPKEGIIINLLRKKDKELEISKKVLLIHLKTHEGTSNYNEEANINNIKSHLNWSEKKIEIIIDKLLREELINKKKNILYITNKGEKLVKII